MRKQYSNTFKAELIKELMKEEKTISQLASEHGIHPTQLKEWKRIALAGLPELFSRKGNPVEQLTKAHAEAVEELYAEIGRLTTQVNWLKKNLASTLPVTVQAELLGVSRASLYYQAVAPSAAEIALKHRIDELYTAFPFYGSRRMLAQLQRDGQSINRKTVQRYMREMGIQGICPGPNLSKRAHAHAVYPYLLRNVTAAYPNHVWGIDITYIRLHQGWMYLVAILDWYSRYVVAWQLDDTLAIDFVLAAVEQALAQQCPQIWNSDQAGTLWVHFTSPQYIQRLLDAKVQISMDGKGRALDNIFTERAQWAPRRTVKYAEVYLHDYLSPKAARQGLATYFLFYNQRRLHHSLGYLTPSEVYFKNLL